MDSVFSSLLLMLLIWKNQFPFAEWSKVYQVILCWSAFSGIVIGVLSQLRQMRLCILRVLILCFSSVQHLINLFDLENNDFSAMLFICIQEHAYINLSYSIIKKKRKKGFWSFIPNCIILWDLNLEHV